MPDVRMPNGTIIKNVPEGITQAELLSRLEASGYKRDTLLAAPAAPAPAPNLTEMTTAKPPEKQSLLGEMGREFVRGVGSLGNALATVTERVPSIIRETPVEIASMLEKSQSPVTGGMLSRFIAEAITPESVKKATKQLDKDWVEATAPTTSFLREKGEALSTSVLPRQTPGFAQAEGFGESLRSLLVSGAGSAPPLLAAFATQLATRNPRLASTVLGTATVPQTYTGIIERQKETGNIDEGAAIRGTVASAALDLFTGAGGKIRQFGVETLERGLANAAKEVAKTGAKESGTEMLQNVIEQVAGGADPTTKQNMLETLEAGLVGGLLGGTTAAAVEGAGAIQSRREAKKAEEQVSSAEAFAQSPEVQQEYLRVVTQEVSSLMEQNPDLTQRQAFDQVKKNIEPLYQTAIENVIMASGGVDEGAGLGAGLDVVGGVEPSVPDVGELGGAPVDTGAVGEAVAGRVGEPDLGVSVPPVGEAAQPSTLAVEPVTVEAAPPVAFDTTPVFEAKSLKDRKAAADMLISDVVQSTPELQGLSKKTYTTAANQMAKSAARGEQFDPISVVYNVAGIEPAPVPEVAAPETAAPRASTITQPEEAAPTFTPQQIAENLSAFARSEAEDRGYDPAMFGEGVRDVQRGGDFLPDDLILEKQGPEALDSYKAGIQWTQERLAEAQAAPEEVAAPAFEEPQFAPTNIAERDTAFKALADAQRGEPEAAMREVQNDTVAADMVPGYSTYGFLLEHVGDLTNRMADPDHIGATFGKLDNTLAVLDNEIDVAQLAAIPPTPQIEAYAAAHEQLPVYNEPQRLARDAAVALGRKDFEAARANLTALKEMQDNGMLQEEAAKYDPNFEAAAPPAAPPTPPPPPTGGTPPTPPQGPKKQPKVVSKGKEVTLTEAQRREAITKADTKLRKLNRIQKRIAATNKTDEVLSAQVDLAKLARGDKENIALLKGSLDTLNALKWRTILPTLSAEDIFRIIGDRIPSLNEADRIIRQDITRFETKEYLKLAQELEQVATFLKKFPKATQALSDLQFASVAYQVDPSKAATAEEYAAKFDKKTKELQQSLASEQDPKKQKSLGTKIKNRFGEIKSVYEGALTDDGRVFGWKDLGRPELGANRGKEIFKLIRDAHRRDLEASYNALRSRLMETKEGEKLDEALEKLEKQFKPAMDQTIYFPAMRFGSFYARVGTGENSIFKMFETENKRNQFVRLMEARGQEVSETGNVEDLRNNFQKTAGGPLKEVLDLFEDNPKDMSALRGQVFDLWLQTMSAGDMRKHMAPRKMRAGYSTDILKNYANFRRSSINGTKRATYGYKLQNAIEAAQASVEKQPDEPKLQAFIEEIRLRATNDLTPPSRDDTFLRKAISLGNKAAFYQYLANPKTALIQLTQLHIVALPMLSQKYGTVEATMALSKYGFSSLGGLVASPLKAIKREDGTFSFNWEQPNLLENPASTLKKDSDPELYEVLSEGWQEGLDLNLYMDTFANDIGGYGMLDPNQRNALQELTAGRPVTAALRGATFTFEAMGALMHQMERTNREATYMAALELGYREARKAGKSHDAAKQEAIEAAVETTLAATFDFSAYNKPRILTSDVGRLAGQFMTYPYMMSSLLVRNMYTAIKFGPLEPGERLAAAQIAAGSLLNIGLYAGLTGLPFYGLAKLIGSMLAWAFDDDDEEGGLSYVDADGNVKATYDIDWWFRNVFIPRHFGADGTVANLFGLDDATAETLARAVEKGPISAITDVDLANSVALDFMFFLPEAPRAEKPEQQLVETVFNTVTGAAGGVAMDYIKAGQDAMNGYTLRALEKLPKLYGNAAKAMRFSEEGQRTYQGELLGMDKDFWTSDKAILLSLGFNSTEAGQRQKQFYDAKKLEKGIAGERNKVLSQWRKFIVDVELKGYTPELQAERDRVLEARDEFNREFPTDPIGTDTLFEVQTNALEKMRKSEVTRGVPIDEKSPYLKDILVRRLNAEETEAQ